MDRFDRPRKVLAISLASLAGFVDGVGFLSADSYFVSFMSGNTTRLSVNLAAQWPRAATPALLIAGFVLGVAIGRLVALRSGRWRKPAVLSLVFLLLLGAASADMLGFPRVMLAALVLAMGAINNTLQRGETPIGLTYMTGALVRLGQGLGGWLCGERTNGWPLYLLLWAGLAGGALAGAFAWLQMGGAALWLTVVAAALLVLFAGWPAARAPS